MPIVVTLFFFLCHRIASIQRHTAGRIFPPCPLPYKSTGIRDEPQFFVGFFLGHADLFSLIALANLLCPHPSNSPSLYFLMKPMSHGGSDGVSSLSGQNSFLWSRRDIFLLWAVLVSFNGFPIPPWLSSS